MTTTYLKQVLLRRGNTAVSSAYTGPVGEITIDTDLETIRVHDGVTPGGRLATSSYSGTTPPASPRENMLWYDTAGGRLYVYYDGAWVDASPAGDQEVIARVNALDANVGTLSTDVQSLEANIGAFETAIDDSVQSLSANIGTFETTTTNRVNALDANIGTFETSVTGTVNTINANINSLNETIAGFEANAGPTSDAWVDTAPPDISNVGALWYDSETGRLYVYYDGAWIDASPPSTTGFANVLPSANVTYSLGSEQYQWKDLWVSSNTIYVGNTPLTVENGSLLVDGNVISGSENGGPDFYNLSNSNLTLHPTQIQIGDNLTGYEVGDEGSGIYRIDATGGGSTGQINFDNTDIYGPSNEIVRLYAQDDSDNIRASLTFDPGDGYPVATLRTAYTNDSTFYDDAWTGSAQWISNGSGGRVDFTSETLKNFLQNTLIYCDNIFIEVNGQNAGAYYGANTGPGYVQFNVENPPVESPDMVVSIRFIYDEVGQIYLDHNDSSIEINGGSALDIRLRTQQTIGLQAGTKNWNFDTNGNITLPNGGDIRYSNGQSVLGGGSGTPAGNNGEIQFNANGAFGSSDSLYFADIDSELTLFTDYLNAPGIFTNDISPSDTGGNVTITTAYPSTKWKFGVDGNLTIPYDFLTLDSGYETGTAGFIAPTGGVALGSTMLYNSGNIASQILQNREAQEGTVQISLYKDTADPAKIWTFNNDGNLTLPQGGMIVEGNSPAGLGKSIMLKPADAGDPNQYLHIYPTGGEGNHIHLTSGDPATMLYLGDDSHYVRLDNSGTVRVQAYDGMSGGTWDFNADGSLNFPSGAGFARGDSGILKVNDTNTQALDMRDASGAGFYTDTPGFTIRSNSIKNWVFGRDGKLTTAGNVNIVDNTNSISTTTGALVVGGGMGVQSDVHIGGTVNITDTTPSTDYSTGALVVNGGVGVNGNINLTGNINILNGNINIQEFTGSTGNFYGDVVTGFNAFYAGKSGFTPLPYTVAQFSTASNTYSQINMENISTGKLASADFVGTGDIGTDSSWFFDLGIANSGYDPVLAAQNNAPGTSVGPLDTYFYVQGNVDVPETGGNLTIGTSQTGKVVKFIAGGTNTANIVMTIKENAVVVTQNLTAPNLGYAADVAAANAAIVTANSAVVSYTNTLNSAMAANVTASNAAIVTANNAVVSYTNTLNSAMGARVDAANAAIVTANSAVVSYVNTLNSAMAANVAAANAAIITANTAMKSYVDGKSASLPVDTLVNVDVGSPLQITSSMYRVLITAGSSSSYTFTLPDTNTCAVGQSFVIASSNLVTQNYGYTIALFGGASSGRTLTAGTNIVATCVAQRGGSAESTANWKYSYQGGVQVSGGGAQVLSVAPSISGATLTGAVDASGGYTLLGQVGEKFSTWSYTVGGVTATPTAVASGGVFTIPSTAGLSIGQAVTITGTNTGTGTITGYASGNTYYIIGSVAASGASSFTLSAARNSATAVTTSAGTLAGLTMTFGAQVGVNPFGGLGHIVNVTGTINSNFDVSFQSVNQASAAYSLTLIINQGATPYMIGNLYTGSYSSYVGNAQTINWAGGSVPTGTANKKDVVTLSWLPSTQYAATVVLGQLQSFG